MQRWKRCSTVLWCFVNGQPQRLKPG